MADMLDKGISNIVSMCAKFYMNNANASQNEYIGNTLYDLLKKTLSNAFRGISLLQQSAFTGWSADDNHPGYLIKIDAPYIIRAPFHIIPVFPTGEYLDDVCHISRLIKTDQHSVICISGSSTTIRVTRIVNDIDFCEYIINCPDLVDSILTKTIHTEQLLFRKLQFNGKRWSPVDAFDVRNHLIYIDPNRESLAYGKIDYIVNVGAFRPCDVSNVMIFCNENWESSACGMSFPAQEVLLDASLFIPNQLCNPFELGRYVVWLNRQIDYYVLHKQTLKAIKRALSLARINFLPEVTEDIKRFLEASIYVYEEEAKVIERLINDISAIDGNTYKSWIEELVAEKEVRRINQSKMCRSIKKPEKSLDDFLHEIRERLAEYGDYQSVAA